MYRTEKINVTPLFNSNKFFKTIKLKKQYIKKFKNHALLTQHHKKAYTLLSNNQKSFLSDGKYLITYIINISFTKTNTLMHVTDFSGKLKFFYSAGSFSFKGKLKKARSPVFKEFHKVLITKLGFLKGKFIALHLKNLSFNRWWVIRALKKRFLIKIVRNFNVYPYNGCRAKKQRRKKKKWPSG